MNGSKAVQRFRVIRGGQRRSPEPQATTSAASELLQGELIDDERTVISGAPDFATMANQATVEVDPDDVNTVALLGSQHAMQSTWAPPAFAPGPAFILPMATPLPHDAPRPMQTDSFLAIGTPAPIAGPMPGTFTATQAVVAAAPHRTHVWLIVIGGLAAATASAAVGRFAFATTPTVPAAATPAAVTTPPLAVATTPVIAATPTPPPVVAEPAKPAPLSLATLDHPVLATVTATSHGTIAKVIATSDHELKPGDALVEITYKQSGGGTAVAAAKRVNELQALAKQDPATYEPFLASARLDLARAQTPSTARAVVKTTARGMFTAQVHVGDAVKQGDVLGLVLDVKRWTASVTSHDFVSSASSCAIADASHTAACKIESTEAVSDGTRVTVDLDATAVPWLDGLAQHPTLTFAR